MKYPAVDPGFRRWHEWWVWGGVGWGVLLDSGPIQKAKAREGGGGEGPDTKSRGGGCYRLRASYGKKKGGGGEYDRVSGGSGYSTVVEFLRAGINRQRKCAAIIIKCGPKSYEFINGGGGWGARLDVIVVGTLLVCPIWYISPLVWLCMCM